MQFGRMPAAGLDGHSRDLRLSLKRVSSKLIAWTPRTEDLFPGFSSTAGPLCGQSLKRMSYHEIPPRVDHTLIPLGSSPAKVIFPLRIWWTQHPEQMASIFREQDASVLEAK